MVQLIFQLSQHVRDEQLVKSFIDYFQCGHVGIRKDGIVYFRVSKFYDIIEKIIPFFKKYPVIGEKSKDFADWCEVAELMKNRAHLTAEGLENIKKIKAGMNRGRK